MTDGRYASCSIYVRAPDDGVVTGVLEQALGVAADGGVLRVPGVEMDARVNPDADAGEPDDFVFWPVLVEADADAPDEREPMSSVMSRVVVALWEAGHPAVAACRFEDELPWNGGIRRVTRSP